MGCVVVTPERSWSYQVNTSEKDLYLKVIDIWQINL